MNNVAVKKERAKRSKIWSISSEEFELLVKKSKTYTEILNFLNYNPRGGAFKLLKQRIKIENVDDKHILPVGKAIKYAQLSNEKSDDEIFCENSLYKNGKGIKQRLFRKGIEEKCAICGIKALWNGLDLVLQLDHINGISNDNRIENLRILCPNCHSQTETFCGKKKSKNKNVKGKSIYKGKTFTKKQIAYFEHLTGKELFYKRKVERPSKDTLKDMLWKMPTIKIAEMFNVSDKSVEKWAKNYGLAKPPRGYWAKQKSTSE